ncbi:MAG: SDR family NAD(P)-dependent oxidoreductase [Chloroflexi bacterium]|nr:SDR family NAD(P)-dependent oxidoreductase [Chloroflexota bacterium]
MKQFHGRVAVITGAASGIGRGLAEQCAAEGMRIVLADIEEAALAQVAAELRAEGAQTITVQCDVAKPDDTEMLAQRAYDLFGAVHLLFNNAGVGGGSTIWESTPADWEWVMGVNLYGVVNSLRAFVPRLLAQPDESHIVNTASIYGLINGPGSGIYKASKFAAVAVSETLYHELAQRTTKVRVSVLCPGFVATRIQDADRNRPPALQNAAPRRAPTAQESAWSQMTGRRIGLGQTPRAHAEAVFEAIRADRFYILPHPEWLPALRARMERMLDEALPANLLDSLPPE